MLGNYGLAILATTVLVKAAFFPLANKSYESMAKMKKLQPEMEKIRDRFKDDRVKQQQELMALYKNEKINPASGCLPIVLQIPVFFALYKVLFVTIDMRHAPFFGWIKDLSAPDPTSLFNLFGLLPYQVPEMLHVGVWPLIMGMTMWVQMQLNPQQPDPVQQKIFNWMPVIFTFMLASFPSGLVIYWAWNNVLSLLQQYTIMRKNNTEVHLWKNLGADKWKARLAAAKGVDVGKAVDVGKMKERFAGASSTAAAIRSARSSSAVQKADGAATESRARAMAPDDPRAGTAHAWACAPTPPSARSTRPWPSSRSAGKPASTAPITPSPPRSMPRARSCGARKARRTGKAPSAPRGMSRGEDAQREARDAQPAAFTPDELAAGEALFARPWQFVKSAPALQFLPEADRPEIAFAGRSNVGKSSLINALVRRRGLARASNTPGPHAGAQLSSRRRASRSILVDMPGYGFAEAPKAKVEAWTRLVKAYLRGRPTLLRVFLLIDARHGLKRVDLELMELMDEAAVSYQAVLTKADKVKPQHLAAIVGNEAELGKHAAAFARVLATSAQDGAGIPELRPRSPCSLRRTAWRSGPAPESVPGQAQRRLNPCDRGAR